MTPWFVGPGDGDIAFAPDGTLWWAGLSAPDAIIPLQSSADVGTTWGLATDVADGEQADREWIDVDGNGTCRPELYSRHIPRFTGVDLPHRGHR
ncbi:MAG TPA: hypothetical protein VM327_02430 [Candidatus Thermoplasmatota archaeon]|nr:hypothetical protein [Candidatus Thermoplasmatota archaeon]